MAYSSSSSHTNLTMEDFLETVDIVSTTTQLPNTTVEHPLDNVNKIRPNAIIRTMLHGQSADNDLVSNNSTMHKGMTNRQRAEMQLECILNDPDASLPAFERRASDHLSNNKIPIDEASKLLNTQPFLLKRLVNALYKSEKKELDKSDVQKLTRVLNSTMDVRALLFYMMLDENNNGYLTTMELAEFYEEYFKGIKTFDKNRATEVIPILLERFHLNEQPRIDFEEFFSIVSKDATLLECLSQFTIDPTWYIKSKPENQTAWQRFLSNIYEQPRSNERKKHILTVDYIKNNLARVIFVTIYLLVNFALALYVIIYRSAVTKSNVLVVLARVGGMLLNFNCTVIVILMLKRTILLIRSSPILRTVIPIDDHIDFHRYVGRVIAGLAILHTLAHMANFGRLTDYSWATYMFTTIPDLGWVGGFAPLSGVILCVILAIMVIFSMDWIRRGGHFQIFYWTHLLYFVFFVFLIVHATNFWHWIIGPFAIFLLEKAYSMLTRFSSLSGRTHLHSVTIQQSNVISLKIHRPQDFTFKPGDYISINIPSVALYEFHPFTLSSAPENTKYLTVHIQACGNWTKLVYKRFKDMSDNNKRETSVKIYRADIHPEEGIASEENTQTYNAEDAQSHFDPDDSMSIASDSETELPKEIVLVNGPYSSCARYVFDCEHVVLIGGGIGITPYAAILSSLMAQFRASRIVCKNCQHINYHRKGLVENHRLKKVDFIWVNRDQKNFEWFLTLLHRFEEEQEYYLAANSNDKRFLDIHLYFTEIKHDENIGHVPLDFVTKIWAQVAGRDIFTSLKSKTHVGRPKWDEIFTQMVSGENESTANDVHVFFCGPATMGKSIQEHCIKYKCRFYEEKF